MSFEIAGVLHKVFQTETKGESFQVRDFVIKTSGDYPQFIKFQLTQDRCGVIDTFNAGDTVNVHFDLRGREWNEKFFTNLNAWKVGLVSSNPIEQAKPVQKATPISTNVERPLTDEDDLPF